VTEIVAEKLSENSFADEDIHLSPVYAYSRRGCGLEYNHKISLECVIDA